MSNKKLEAKAKSLLSNGAVQILQADQNFCQAIVRGSSSIHKIHIFQSQNTSRAGCSCKSQHICSHILAVLKVWQPMGDPSPKIH